MVDSGIFFAKRKSSKVTVFGLTPMFSPLITSLHLADTEANTNHFFQAQSTMKIISPVLLNMLLNKKAIALLFICIFFLLSACRDKQAAEQVQTILNLHEFTGGSPVRLVWVQDILDNKDVSAQGEHLRLMGYDSEDGKGEQIILAGPGNFFRPLITPSGQQVVFSDFHQRKVQVVDWSGENRHYLTRGRALAVWRDPADGIEWIYVGRGAIQDSPGPGSERLYRVQLKNPVIEELVWNKAPFGGAVHVSGDGRRFSAEVAGAACALIDIDRQEAYRQGKGCWPAVAPDYSYRFWFFDGAHRNLEMVDTRQGTRNRIYLANAPGIEGHEVYHPRWSNHPRYMAMTGPYTIRQGGNNIRGGGGGVEIYIGRFNESYTDVEAWFQVSTNQRADFYPDLWLASDEQVVPAKVLPADPSDQVSSPPKDSDWPVVNENLLFAWENVAAENKWISPAEQLYQAEFVARDMARFALNYQMRLGSGWYVASRLPKPDPREYAIAKGLSLEFVTTLPEQQQQTDGLLLVLGAENDGQTILRVDQGVLVLEEKRKGQAAQIMQLGRLPVRKSHVLLTIEPAKVTFRINSSDSKMYPRASSEIIVWPLTTGDPRPQKRSRWNGLLERVALYSGVLDDQEIKQTEQLFTQMQKSTNAIKPLVVRAELVSTSSIPTPEDILPYRRGLVVNEYRIVEVVQGSIQDKVVLIAHWAILNGKSLPEADRTVGEVYELHLDAFDNRPELEGERLSMESDNLLLTMYYDLDS